MGSYVQIEVKEVIKDKRYRNKRIQIATAIALLFLMQSHTDFMHNVSGGFTSVWALMELQSTVEDNATVTYSNGLPHHE